MNAGFDIRDYTLRLGDGRTLGVMEAGSRDGPVVIHCHGHTSSRLEIRLFADAAERQGVRLICMDRPGIGLSDPLSGFRILDWPRDVEEAAKILSIERFAVQGMSAGGIYALAFACKPSPRLAACGLISTVAPSDMIRKAGADWMKRIWWMGDHWPRLFWLQIRFKSWMRGSSVKGFEKQVNQYPSRLGERDRKTFADTRFREGLARALTESCRQGREANLSEAHDNFGPWGFEPGELTFEHIYVWHGEDDLLMAPATVHMLVEAMPRCHATFYPHDGHFSLPMNHMDEILATLKAVV